VIERFWLYLSGQCLNARQGENVDNSWWWWIGGAVVLAFIAVTTVPAIIGASISVREAGRRHLSAEIKKFGIRQYIPDACAFEVADHVTDIFSQYAQMKGQGGMWAKNEMLESLERDARVILEWVRGRDIAGDRTRYIPDALTRHGVPLGVATGRAQKTGH
jgi:hypothetical protein